MLYKPASKLPLVRCCLPQTKVSETSAIPVKAIIPVFSFFFKEKDTNLSHLFRESNMVVWCHCCESSCNLDLLNGYYSTLNLVIWKQYNNLSYFIWVSSVWRFLLLLAAKGAIKSNIPVRMPSSHLIVRNHSNGYLLSSSLPVLPILPDISWKNEGRSCSDLLIASYFWKDWAQVLFFCGWIIKTVVSLITRHYCTCFVCLFDTLICFQQDASHLACHFPGYGVAPAREDVNGIGETINFSQGGRLFK